MSSSTEKSGADQQPADADAANPLSTVEAGPVSRWLRAEGFDHQVLPNDHGGIETLAVEAVFLQPIAAALKAFGFDYLQCQGAYDEGAGEALVSFYHLVKLSSSDGCSCEEVRLKVFLNREAPSVPSLYGLYRGADWQERECYDLFGIHYEGHPHPNKRLLMPEDWKGWPLRKDYVQPDFYELQDAY